MLGSGVMVCCLDRRAQGLLSRFNHAVDAHGEGVVHEVVDELLRYRHGVLLTVVELRLSLLLGGLGFKVTVSVEPVIARLHSEAELLRELASFSKLKCYLERFSDELVKSFIVEDVELTGSVTVEQLQENAVSDFSLDVSTSVYDR